MRLEDREDAIELRTQMRAQVKKSTNAMTRAMYERWIAEIDAQLGDRELVAQDEET